MAELQVELVELLEDVRRTIVVHVRAVMEAHGLSAAAMAVLDQIRTEEGITLSEVARRSGMAKSQVSTTVDDLVMQGMLEKRPDPQDQRLVRLHMTDLAYRKSRAVREEVQERLSQALAGLPEDEMAAMAGGLRTLKALLARQAVQNERRSSGALDDRAAAGVPIAQTGETNQEARRPG